MQKITIKYKLLHSMKRTVAILALLLVGGSAWAEGNDEYVDENGETILADISGNPINVVIKFAPGSIWKSYCSNQDLYFNATEASGEKCVAFIALNKGTADDNGTPKTVINLHAVQYVPNGQGIWIWGEKNQTYRIQIETINIEDERNDYDYDHCSDYNKLIGTQQGGIELTVDDYYLVSTDDYVHSAKLTGAAAANAKMPAHTAFLRIKGSGGAPLRITSEDDDEEILSIDAVCTEDGELIMYNHDLPSYDLQGRLVEGDAKGVHIQNGYRFYLK